ncbi:Dihydroneopterin aldolase [Corynebacterium pseudotuberculosis 267]|nr:Dihydroneopterin aldolase [Corynebacterium pseudotuberculosis 267]
MKGYAYHGVFEHEKREGQEFLVDITCWLTFPTQDDLTQTVHYGELAQLAYGILTGEPRDLIETVASEIADTRDVVFPGFRDMCEVTVHKPHAPIPLEFADVAVVARR